MPANQDSRWWALLNKDPQLELANAQEQCPPYKKDLLISGLSQTLDAPRSPICCSRFTRSFKNLPIVSLALLYQQF